MPLSVLIPKSINFPITQATLAEIRREGRGQRTWASRRANMAECRKSLYLCRNRRHTRRTTRRRDDPIDERLSAADQ